jgi:hypothetical protein
MITEPKEHQLRVLLSDLWRQHPQGPSTFSGCANLSVNGCKRSARGGAECDVCLAKKITRLLGNSVFGPQYIEAIQHIRWLEREMLGILDDELDGNGGGTTV